MASSYSTLLHEVGQTAGGGGAGGAGTSQYSQSKDMFISIIQSVGASNARMRPDWLMALQRPTLGGILSTTLFSSITHIHGAHLTDVQYVQFVHNYISVIRIQDYGVGVRVRLGSGQSYDWDVFYTTGLFIICSQCYAHCTAYLNSNIMLVQHTSYMSRNNWFYDVQLCIKTRENLHNLHYNIAHALT